jgi:hypothetical protein
MAGDTIDLNAVRDKQATGCASIPSLGCKCTFCLSFASLGFGFAYRKHAKNHSGVWHDNCRCHLVPGFGKSPGMDWYDPERYEKLYDHIKAGNIRFQKNADPYEKELDVAIFLADAGYQVRFLKPTGKGRTADMEVDGIRRELKVPEGDPNTTTLGKYNIENQFGASVKPELQSDKLIISHHLIADRMGFDEWMAENMLEWKHWPEINELWLVDAKGRIHKK